MDRRFPPGSPLAEALGAGQANGLVFVAAGSDLGDDFDAVHHELAEAFELSQRAMRDAQPIVYVVAGEDLLGQRGAPAAMVATGLLSAARTAAVEGLQAGVTVNTLAAFADADPADVARWVERLLDAAGVTGELVRLGGGHIGKALP